MHKIFRTARQADRELGKSYRDGEAIFQQGEVANCLYVIQEGRVATAVEFPEGAVPLTTYEVGEVFGEVAVFAGKSRFATARAVGDARVLRVDEKAFIAKLHQDPSVAFRLIQKMAQRIYEQDHELIRSAQERPPPPEDVAVVVGPLLCSELPSILDGEIKRTKRLRQNLAYAILEVDDAKGIQKRFGVEGGYAVAAGLTEVVRGRLRRTDYMARDGLRMPLILSDADGPSAVRLLEGVRKEFGRVVHRVGEAAFSATLSAAVAVYPEHKEAEALRDAVGGLMRRMRGMGKDQVVLAPPAASWRLVS